MSTQSFTTKLHPSPTTFCSIFWKIKHSPTKVSLRNKNRLPLQCPAEVITAFGLHTHFSLSGNRGSIKHIPAPQSTSLRQGNAPKVKDLFTFLAP